MDKNPDPSLALPSGSMKPIGYVVQQHAIRLDRATVAYKRWAERIPCVYHEAVLGESDYIPSPADDPERLALLKLYRGLMPMAQEARKPIFQLKPADGAIGAHSYAVQDVYKEFHSLADRIATRSELFEASV